ncbi:MAG: (2Fe-2S) ferredoxin domain-containing protein, partial [bacterium]
MKLTVDDLKRIKEEHKAVSTLREGGQRAKITVHMGTCGIAAGARNVMSAIMDEIATRNITDIIITTSGCAGMCSKEPMITIEIVGKSPVKYGPLDSEKTKRVFDEHIINGNILADYAIGIGCETTY